MVPNFFWHLGKLWKQIEMLYPCFGLHKHVTLHIFAGFIMGNTSLPHSFITEKKEEKTRLGINRAHQKILYVVRKICKTAFCLSLICRLKKTNQPKNPTPNTTYITYNCHSLKCLQIMEKKSQLISKRQHKYSFQKSKNSSYASHFFTT